MEARAIVKNAQDNIDFDLEADGILYHVMEYLQGKDLLIPGMWTREFFGEYEEDEEFEQSVEKNYEILENLGCRTGRFTSDGTTITEVEKGKAFLQQLKDTATSREEVKDEPKTA